MASTLVHPHPTSPRRLQRQGCVSFSLEGEGLVGSSSLQGEGLAVAGDLDFLADDFQYAVGVAEHIVVPETDDAEAVGFDQSGAFDVVEVVGMLAAIEFDDEAQAATGEVGDIRADGILENEFRILDLTVADALPQAFFRFGAVAAKGAGDARQFCQDKLPLPDGERVGVWGSGRQVRKLPLHPLIQLRLSRFAAKASYPSPPREKVKEN